MLILPALGFLEGCGNSGTGSGSSLTATSSSVGHTHTFTISAANLSAPPDAGLSGADSTSGGHNHVVTLTKAQLTNIAAGTAVTVSSSTVDSHSHSYTFQRTT